MTDDAPTRDVDTLYDRINRKAMALWSKPSARTLLYLLFGSVPILTLVLFTEDYFRWWSAPWSPSVDRALLRLLVVIVVFTGLIVSALGILFLLARIRDNVPFRTARDWQRLLWTVFWPPTFVLTALWAYSCLTGFHARFWGHVTLCYFVAYFIADMVLVVLRTSQEARQSLRRKNGL